jgi:TfoX/Sxy family transcriptional regulator of competence genes
MAYDEALARRVRAALENTSNVEERRMFGGLAFLVNGKMCVSVSGRGGLMCRMDPVHHESATQREGWTAVVMRGRPMRGYVRISPTGLKAPGALRGCIRDALRFNRTLK